MDSVRLDACECVEIILTEDGYKQDKLRLF